MGAAYGALRGPDEAYPDLPKRISYLIGPDAKVVHRYEVSDVAAHADEVLADLRAARSGSGA